MAWSVHVQVVFRVVAYVHGMIGTYYDPNLFLNIILPCYTVADDTKYDDIIGKLCVSIVSISGPKVHIIAHNTIHEYMIPVVNVNCDW